MIFPLSVSDQFGSSVAKLRRAAASICEKSAFPAENIKITTPIDFYTFKAYLDVKDSLNVIGL